MQRHITKIKLLGKYLEPVLKEPTNVYKGKDGTTGSDCFFWYLNKKRIFISKFDWFDKWKKTT